MPDNALFVGPLDRVLSLKTLPVFEALSTRDLVAVAQRMRERFIPRGSLLLRQGKMLSASYLVLDGRVELQSEKGVVSVESGGTVGLLELLARTPFPAEARTVVDTLALELDADDQEDIWEDRFMIMLGYIKTLAREVLAEQTRRAVEATGATVGSANVFFRSPLNLVERVLTLQRVRMLSSESIDAVAEISRNLTEIRVERGKPLWRRDERPEHFWVILSGRARTKSPSTPAVDLGSGACAGLEEVLADAPCPSDAWAEETLSTLRIDREPFIDVLEDHFPLAREIVARLAEDLLEIRGGSVTT